MTETLQLAPIFFLIALTYAMAGFGGGSSYLAVLALTALPTPEMRLTALVCNIIVTGGGLWYYVRAGVVPWRKALPLVLCSVPAAYVGGRIALPREQFLGLLGVVLLVAGAMMWQRTNTTEVEEVVKEKTSVFAQVIIGGALGFLAGLVSIGGGIFLSPLLFLQRWGKARQIAAVTSLFILANSLAGLGGQLSAGARLAETPLAWLALAVLLGGQVGSRLTVSKLSPTVIRRVAAGLILLVGLRLLVQTVGAS